MVWAVWRQWAVGDVIQVLNGLAAPESVNPEDPPELAWCGPHHLLTVDGGPRVVCGHEGACLTGLRGSRGCGVECTLGPGWSLALYDDGLACRRVGGRYMASVGMNVSNYNTSYAIRWSNTQARPQHHFLHETTLRGPERPADE